MPASYPLPFTPWIKPADEASHLAQGIQLGEGLARQRLLEQQQQYNEQQNAVEQARADMAFKQQSEDRARKFAAQQQYQQRIRAGEDPMKVLLELGPSIGGQASPEAAAIRSMQMQGRVGQMTPFQQAQVDHWKTPLAMTPFQQAEVEKWKKPKAGVITVPLNPDDPLGSAKITGPADDPNVIEAMKRAKIPVPKTGQASLEQPKPLPKDKKDLVKDETYQTPKGLLKWDGEKFVKASQ